MQGKASRISCISFAIIFDRIFRSLLKPLIIIPVRSVDSYNQKTILPLIVFNRPSARK
jgi:hypothetical protein